MLNLKLLIFLHLKILTVSDVLQAQFPWLLMFKSAGNLCCRVKDEVSFDTVLERLAHVAQLSDSDTVHQQHEWYSKKGWCFKRTDSIALLKLLSSKKRSTAG